MMKFYSLRRRLPVTMKTILFSLFFSFTFHQSSAQLGNALQYTGDGSINTNGYPNFQYLQMPNGSDIFKRSAIGTSLDHEFTTFSGGRGPPF